jgi:hypothetical protein
MASANELVAIAEKDCDVAALASAPDRNRLESAGLDVGGIESEAGDLARAQRR